MFNLEIYLNTLYAIVTWNCVIGGILGIGYKMKKVVKKTNGTDSEERSV